MTEKKDLILAKELMGDLVEVFKGIPQESMRGILDWMINIQAPKEFKKKVQEISDRPTPENVKKEREGPGGIDLTYVQLGYLLKQLRDSASTFEFDCVDSPHIPVLYVDGKARSLAYYLTMWTLTCKVVGIVTAKVPCPGTCDIQLSSSGGKWIGVETAYKGCVTDAMKKGISYAINAAHDVYDYGEDTGIDNQVILGLYNELVKEFGAAVVEPRANEIVTFLSGAKGKESLDTRMETLRHRFEDMKIKQESENKEQEGETSESVSASPENNDG